MKDLAPLNLQLDFETLNEFMPIYILFDSDWKIRRFGRTMAKLGMVNDHIGQHFLNAFDVLRPRKFIQNTAVLDAHNGKVTARM